MLKKLVTFLATGLFAIGMAGVAGADPITNTAGDGFEDLITGETFSYYENSGDLMFWIPGNDSNYSNLQADVASWLNANTAIDTTGFTLSASTSSIEVSGWDGSDTGGLNFIGSSSTEGKVEFPDGYTSGTWNVVPETDTISFYVVKAADAFAMYHVTPADNDGSWSTYDLWAAGYGGASLEISHFTGFNSASTPVPEPTTMLLFGAGLVALGGYARRQSRKN